MNEQNPNNTVPETPVRPTKKQREILKFIENFIGEHGYSPSYREIMTGLEYTSVATVSLHVNSLIKRGHLRKRDHNARSIELVQPAGHAAAVTTNIVRPNEEKWLVEKIEHHFRELEQQGQPDETARQQAAILIDALRILGLDGAAQSFAARLHAATTTDEVV